MSYQIPIQTVLNNRYMVMKKMKAGGQGIVYQVADLNSGGNLLVLKELIIDPKSSQDDRDDAVQLFQQEFDLLRSLNHPNIPKVVEYFNHDVGYLNQGQKVPCFVMEYIAGETLDTLLRNQPGGFSEEKVLRWGFQIATTFQYLHAQIPPIIFRDLKPSNLMLVPPDTIKLIDFGIARRHKQNKRNNTFNMGTLLFCPPEAFGLNADHWGPSDERSDVFTYGATLYNLLTSLEPPNIINMANNSLVRPANWPPDPSTVKHGLSPQLVELIKKSLGYEKSERWQSFGEVINHITSFRPDLVQQTNVQIAPPKDSSQSTSTQQPVSPPGIICPSCKSTVRAGAKFCNKCGCAMTLKSGSVTNPRLRLRANGSMVEVPLTPLPFLIGRTVQGGNVATSHPGLDLKGIDNSISRRHAEIRNELKGFTILDLGSTNGTKVNNTSLDPNNPRPLRHGDRISLSQQIEIQFLLN